MVLRGKNEHKRSIKAAFKALHTAVLEGGVGRDEAIAILQYLDVSRAEIDKFLVDEDLDLNGTRLVDVQVNESSLSNITSNFNNGWFYYIPQSA